MKKKFLLSFASVLFVLTLTAQTNVCKLELIDGFPNKTVKNKVETNLSTLLSRFNQTFSNDLEQLSYDGIQLTENAKHYIEAIWSAGKFKCLETNIRERLLKTHSGYELRNIPISLDGTNQQLVFALDVRGTITDVYFSVAEHQYKNIVANNRVIDETKKNIIRDFLESFKTSYIKKDIDFINMVFSDKALIVVGKTISQSEKESLKVTDTGKHTLYESGSNSTYKKMTKTEYIDGLKRVFRSNKKIKVDFNDIEIIPHRKSGYEEFYGVRLKQRWQADNYQDYGLLFFVIQFRENEHPLIWVRVWQDANTTSEADQIGLGEILIQPK